jgi:nitrogen fixation/metabolism regulation signal transduction histidine kinase
VAPWCLAAIAPLAAAGGLLVGTGLPPAWRAVVFAAGLATTLVLMAVIGWHMIHAWRTLESLLAALRAGEYSSRARLPSVHHPLRGLVADINMLSDTLREGRRKRTESLRFLGKTLTTLQDPLFVVDRDNRLVMINPSARALVGVVNDSVIGRDIDSLGLGPVVAVAENTILSWDFAARSGRWIVHRAVWYSEGHENTMFMMHDVSVALGEEERDAWQRLIRVLSHELNNSLAPIGSLAGSLSALLEDEGGKAVEGELRQGLEVIGRRAASLARFLAGYGRLASLPPMHPRPFRLDTALRRLAMLEHRLEIVLLGTVPVTLVGDADQLDQAFINLLRNAVESAAPMGGAVRIDWAMAGPQVRVTIEDEGVGLPERGSLFVPFFTTKPTGSGIGLSLTRLIVEAHAGNVDLRNREGGRGALAIVHLPIGDLENSVRIRTETSAYGHVD